MAEERDREVMAVEQDSFTGQSSRYPVSHTRDWETFLLAV